MEKNNKVYIIGAGIAGLAAANELAKHGIPSTILEGRERIGGRIYTDYSMELPISLGAQWMHGTEGNPVAEIADQLKLKYVDTSIRDSLCFDHNRRAIPMEKSVEFHDFFQEKLTIAKNYAIKLDHDISLLFALNATFDPNSLAPIEQDLYFNLIAFLSLYTGGDTTDLSARYWDEEIILPGGNKFMVDSYAPVIEELAKNVDISLNTLVSEINYEKSAIVIDSNQGHFSTNKVIVTVPLGILKNNKIRFTPDLPGFKKTAIKKLKMGVLDCLVLKFPHVFWPKEHFSMSFCDLSLDFNFFINLFYFHDKPILKAWIAGSQGMSLEESNDEVWIEKAMISLRKFFGNDIPSPEQYLRTRWGHDSFAYGSYSYIPIDASGVELDVLAEPIENKLFFAGEATHRLYPASVHGAYLSGIREAQRIISNQ